MTIPVKKKYQYICGGEGEIKERMKKKYVESEGGAVVENWWPSSMNAEDNSNCRSPSSRRRYSAIGGVDKSGGKNTRKEAGSWKARFGPDGKK